MLETYCDKDCDQCQEREALGCPGCKAGPGDPERRECPVSECIHRKGGCGVCRLYGDCTLRQSRGQMPKQWLRIREEKAQNLATMTARAPMLKVWCLRLMIVTLLGAAGAILRRFSALLVLGQILETAADVGFGVCLLALRKEDARYGKGAAGYLLAACCGLAMLLLPSLLVGGLPILLRLIMAVARAVAMYLSFSAHAAVLKGGEDTLGRQWMDQGGIGVGLCGLTFLAYACSVISGTLCSMMLTVVALVAAVTGIVQAVYLRKMTEFFREYC